MSSPERDWPADLRALRAKLGLSQSGLATRLGISVRTLQQWEQGRRTPRGPAAALLEHFVVGEAPMPDPPRYLSSSFDPQADKFGYRRINHRWEVPLPGGLTGISITTTLIGPDSAGQAKKNRHDED